MGKHNYANANKVQVKGAVQPEMKIQLLTFQPNDWKFDSPLELHSKTALSFL